MKSTLLFISLLLILVALIVENIFREAKNIPSNTNDPFNSTRAYNHLKEIAKERHPIASEANKKVQDYIVGQLKNIKNNIANNTNVAMEIVDSDDTELLWSSNSNEYFKSSNVLCKVIGKNEALDPSSPSFLLSAHYDSVPSSYGASDDGGGIAILLEVVEKIVSQGQPSYTLIVNFNNGEEFGLLGSKSFAKHQWFENVAVFLNMEGGGTGGKEFIFRSTNAELSKLYGESATHPTGDSIGGDFIRSGLIRSVTDFSIYADTYGIPGLDIAFVERRSLYHTNFDDISRIKPGSLQHAGSNIFAFTNQIINPPSTKKDILQFYKSKPEFDENFFSNFLGFFIVGSLKEYRIVTITLLSLSTIFFCIKFIYFNFFKEKRFKLNLIKILKIVGCGIFNIILTISFVIFLSYLCSSLNPLIIYGNPWLVLVLFSFSFVFVQSIIQRISFCPNSDIKIDSPESATNVENQAASSGALLEAQTLLETENSLLKMMGSKNKNTLDVSFQNEAHLQQCYSFGFWYFCNWAALAMTYYDMPTLTFPVFWLAFGLLGSVVYTILKYFLDEERKVAEDDDLNPTTTKTVIEEHKMLVLKELPWLTQFLISFVFPAFHTFLFFINISMALSPTQIAYFNGIISYVVFGVFVIFCLYGTTPILSRVEKKNVTVATFGLAVIILIIVTLLYPVFNLNEDIAAGNTLQFFQTLDLKSNTLKAEFYGYKGVRNTLINVPSLKEGLCTNEVSGHFFGLGELGEMCTYNLSPEKTINDIAKLNFDEGTQDNEFFHLGNKSILIKNATYTLITESNLTSFEKALNLSISAIKIPDDQFLILPSPNNGHFTRTYISVKLPKNSQICSIRLNSMNLIHSRIPEWPKNEMNEYSNKYKFIPNNLQSRPYLFEIFTNSPTFFLSVHFTCSYFDLKNFAPLFDEVVDHLDNFGSLINYEGLTVTGSYTLHI